MTEYTTTTAVMTEAQLQRQKVLQQQQEAEETARRQAAEATKKVEAQAEETRQKARAEAAEAQEKARAEALAHQATVRKAQGEAEREAEALKGQAREARRVELRKQDLPFTKPERSIVNIEGYVKSVESARVEAHKEGRSARADIERVKDEYVAGVDKQLKDAIADIDTQELSIKGDIAKQLMEAQADIQKQVATLLAGVDEWEAQGIAQLEKATAEYNKLLEAIAPYKKGDGYDLIAMVQAGYNEDTLKTYGFAVDDIKLAIDLASQGTKPVESQEAIAQYKLGEGYNLTAMVQAGYSANTLASYGFEQADITNAQLMAEALDMLKPYKLEGDSYDITRAIMAAEKGEGSWWALNTVFGADVVEAERSNAKQLATFETYKAYIAEDGTIDVKGVIGKYGEAQAQVVLADLGVENPYHTVNMTKPEYAFNYMQATGEIRASAKYLGVDEKTGDILYVDEPTYDDWVKLYFKQPYNIRLSYIFRQAPYLGERSWSSLSEKEQHKVITDFQAEFSYLDSILSMTKAEQSALAKRMLLGLVPVYGTIQNWDNMSTGWKAVSVAVDVATIGLLVYGGIRTFPKAWHDFKITLRDIHLDQRGVFGLTRIAAPKPIVKKGWTTLIEAKQTGLTAAEYEQFLAARVLNPRLSPDTWWFLNKMGQSLTKLIPTVSPSEARAFYGALLPSYAEIIAQGLPKPSTWRPMQKIWKPGMGDTPTVISLNQAASIMSMSEASWAKLVNQMLPSKLPAGVQREVIANAVLGLTADVALANAAMAMAKAKAQGKTQAEIARIGEVAAQSTIQTALKALTQASTLTKAETAILNKLLNKTMTKAEVKTATKILTQAATKADTKTSTSTQTGTSTRTGTGTKTAVQTLTETLTQTKTKTKTKTRVRIRPKPKDEKPKEDKEGRPIYPDGSVVWLMGELKRGQEWKVILPPYSQNKPISSTKVPHGVRVTTGTPQETLTFIGGKTPFRNVAFDLGVIDGYIDVKHKRIEFTGGGLTTNVGKRIPSMTRGITLANSNTRRLPRGKARRSKVTRQPSRNYKVVA